MIAVSGYVKRPGVFEIVNGSTTFRDLIYGDEFSPLSIWNSFSVYGREFSDLSAYDPFASDPPSVYLNGVFQGYLTTNPDFTPRFDPDDVAADIGRYDVIRY